MLSAVILTLLALLFVLDVAEKDTPEKEPPEKLCLAEQKSNSTLGRSDSSS